MKKIFVSIICILMLLTSLTSCSRPPEFAEIEERLGELIEASYGVNDILFGDGLAVYEKAYEHEFLIHRDEESDRVYYYYVINDDELGTIYAYRYTEYLYFIRSEERTEGKECVYVDADGAYYYEIEYDVGDKDKTVSSYEDKSSGEKYYFYKITDETYGTVYEYREQSMRYLLRSSGELSDKTALYKDSEKGYYYYPIDYKEPTYEFYYDDDDPEGYSYVRFDNELTSIEQIKEYAETVYSKQYLEGVYEMLFTGAVVSEDSGKGSLGARYYVYYDEDGQGWLLQSDEYTSLIKGKRIYDLSTAKIVKPGNAEFVNIEIESYLDSEPDNRVTVKLSMVKQDDGKWYLDSATY